MNKNFEWVSIGVIADRILKHPLLQDISLESIMGYTLDFIHIMGLPSMYQEETVELVIENYRTVLPANVVSIIQVRDALSNVALRGALSSFYQYDNDETSDFRNETIKDKDGTYKVQGNILYTSFKDGNVVVSYQSIPVDDSGFPMIPNNNVFLRALEFYIKKEWFNIQFDLGRITIQVLNNAQQQYAWSAGQCASEFRMPSLSEMESITNMWTRLLPQSNEFITGFQRLGQKEYLKRQ